MWVAKNSLTGHEYGKHFESIYDCQSFIDKELTILEYLSQRIKVLEDKCDYCLKIEKYQISHNCSYIQAVVGCFEDSFQPLIKDFIDVLFMNQKEYKKYKNKLKKQSLLSCKDVAYSDFYGGHIIRCYNLSQKRWCTGFDF